jgi:hypothetical protein
MRGKKVRTTDFQGGRWQGQTVCIIASGASLTEAQISEAKRQENWRFIAINDSYKLAPFADVLYACDGKWWTKYHETIDFNGEKWTQDIRAKRSFGLNWVLGRRGDGLGYECVHFGANSGYQAINLAFLWGADRIILLGFDCKSIQGKDHWFGQHPEGLTRNQPYALWKRNFRQLARDLEAENVKVINCSPDSALECFKKASIAQL